ncbi:unnamed protein product, partial [Rotaria sp. Silwood2]
MLVAIEKICLHAAVSYKSLFYFLTIFDSVFFSIGEPDFVFYHNETAKLVGEVKTIWSFAAPDNLAAAYRLVGNTVRLPVQQIFGYLRINNLKYGILTNYENFYFMKRENNALHISTAIKSSDVDVSVYRALYYIVHLSIEDHTCSPNTSKNDNKNYDSDDDELEEDREKENDDDDGNIDYPKRQKKQQQSLNRKKQKSSRSKKLKLTNEVVGYGRNGHVYKSFYDNKICATKICDIIKNKEMITRLKHEKQLYAHLKSLQGIIIPNRITSGYLKNLNWFYIVCYEFSGKPKNFDEYTYDEKQMTLHALRQLHLNNVLHNDLRCENFLVNYDDNNDKHNRTQQQAIGALSHIERIIKEKANLFIKETPKRHRPPSWTEALLDVTIRWLLRQCGRIERESRRKCIELVCTFIPLLPVFFFLFRFEGTISKEKKTRFKANLAYQRCLTDINEQFSLPIVYQWLDTVIASLDCYIWVFSQGFLNPLLFQDNNQQSRLITSLSYFISKISMNTLHDIVSYFPISNQSYVFTRNDVRQFNIAKCTVIVRLLNFITAIWLKYPFDIRRAIDNSLYSNDLTKLILTCVFNATQIGFDINNEEINKKLPERILILLKSMITHLPEQLLQPFYSNTLQMTKSDG